MSRNDQTSIPEPQILGNISGLFGGRIGDPGRRRPSDRRPRRDEYDDEGRRHRDYRSGSEERTREGRERRDYRDTDPGRERVREGRERRDYRDADNDGLSNHDEERHGTDPYDADTDGDGLPDRWELIRGRDPRSFDDHDNDADGDGLTDLREYHLGTDPRRKDSDGDGLTDSEEVRLGTDPNHWDTDGDGRGDATEHYWGVGNGPLTPDPHGRPVPEDRTPDSSARDTSNEPREDTVVVEPITIFRPDLDRAETDDPGHEEPHDDHPVIEEPVDPDDDHETPVPDEEEHGEDLDEPGCDTPGFGEGHTEAPRPIEAPETMTTGAEEPAFGAGADGDVVVVTPVDVDQFEPDIAEIPPAGPMPMLVESPDHQEMPEEEEEPPASIEIDHQIDHSFETDDALDMVEA